MGQQKKIFIHCGPVKTGSSYIQKSLQINSSKLANLGVDVLPGLMSADGDHHAIAQSFSDRNLIGSGQLASQDLVEMIAERAFTGNAHTLVLSSDIFANFKIYEWRRVRELAKMIDAELKIICYGRNLLDIFVSTVSQYAKNGHYVDSLYTIPPFVYYPLVHYSASVFGESTILVRSSSGKSLGEDFWVAILPQPCLGDQVLESPAKHVNTRLSKGQLSAYNYINYYLGSGGCRDFSRGFFLWLINNAYLDTDDLRLSQSESRWVYNCVESDHSLMAEFYPDICRQLVEAGVYDFNPEHFTGLGINKILSIDGIGDDVLKAMLSAANCVSDQDDFYASIQGFL